jgi:tRNA pseudouridine38-40 synthase
VPDAGSPGGSPAPTRCIRLEVEYDGSRFRGWQIQPGQRTVQGALQDALGVVCRHPVVLHGAGRTDAGVHAWAQVAAFRTDSPLGLERIRRGCNALAGPGVGVVSAREAPPDFDPRRDARGKVYAYRILNRRDPSPLLLGRVWHVEKPLDSEQMRVELATICGTADWSGYRAADCGSPNPVKALRRAELRREPRDLLVLEFEGSGFLKQMVRILVGTAVDVGLGRLPPGSMLAIREARDRRLAGPTAPPEGLYLERVIYEPSEGS